MKKIIDSIPSISSFVADMKWAPFKSLFWNTNDSIAELTISFTSGVSLWDRSCY